MSLLPFELIINHLNEFNFKTTSSNDTLRLIESLNGQSITLSKDLESITSSLNRLKFLLQIPESCSVDEEELTAAQILERERFLNQSPSLLSLALSLIRLLPLSHSRPSNEELVPRVQLLLSFGRFSDIFQSDEFVSSRSEQISIEITKLLLSPSYRYPLIHYILTKTFPPLFKSHPKLNPETGRVLSRPRGGERGILDWYEESEVKESWRKEIGFGNVLKVLLNGLEGNEIEELWPKIIPPLLAYLDDYEAKNKLLGTSILSCLLNKVDHSLLRRTGVGLIFQQSLSSCFTTLSSSLTPALLASTHKVSLQLLPLLHPISTNPEDNYNSLCTILSTGIIQTWEFKSNQSFSLELILLKTLKPIMIKMNKGIIRYLGILIPKLSNIIVGNELDRIEGAKFIRSKKMEVQILAGENLLLLIQLSGNDRMKRWEGIILGSIGKCWSSLMEEEVNKKEVDKVMRMKLQVTLREVVRVLIEVLGDDGKLYLIKFLELDSLFSGLIQ